ncbi:hypothetical protein GLAREA_05011 [Glarea lozoyensis ATCC 20868]|uniref:Mid2 domain-containing protein n=1 Tax=Glarea lozoyensis (strain ATCC 20868 / MF5171) TaxID=1116229 RepID=S3DEY7_GLAL2|nr:uncharacterized protein GLAREA_05011 [Glarea lozoyensis ATCC 20868]EPE35674.1 hypothetical protein GLAREA_05011 [Glarea lozoyensis ATCC 20868]
MRVLLLLSIFTILIDTSICVITFINPPAADGRQLSDYVFNTVFVEGTSVTLQWTAGPEGLPTSMTLFQESADGTKALEPFEYVTQNLISNVTTFIWDVTTTKDLTVSNTFFFAIYLDKATSGSSASQFFNITRKPEDTKSETASTSSTTSSTIASSKITASKSSNPSSSTTSKTTSTTSTTEIAAAISSSDTSSTTVSTTTGTSTSPPSIAGTTTLATSTTAPVAAVTSSAATTAAPTLVATGLSNGTKAGLGIGIPAAILFGLSVGWFVFGKKTKQKPHISGPLPIISYQESQKLNQLSRLAFPPTYLQTNSPPYHQPIVPPIPPGPQQLSGESRVVPTLFELQASRR